jgi:acyl-coenzyme A thioesterase 13
VDTDPPFQPPLGFVPANFSPGFLDRGGPYWIGGSEAAPLIGLLIGEGHLNYLDVAHGGVMTTLADVAMSYAVHSSRTPRLAVSTATLTVNFLAGVRLGDWVGATPRIDRIGRNLAHTSGEIRRAGEVVATMSGVFTHRAPG